MLDKFAGLFTQISDLKKKLKKLDSSKNPKLYKETLDALEAAEKRHADIKKKKEERAKAKAEASVEPANVVKESTPEPTQEVVKESTVEKFAIDSKVEPIRGTPGSWGVVMREAGVNGDPLCYVKWMDGNLKEAHGGYGGYYPSDLKLKAEVENKQADYEQSRSEVYNLESDLKSNYEGMIKNLEEELQMAKDKAEYAWVGRLEEKLADLRKAYDERFPMKTADKENGTGGSDKLKVVDFTPPHDKDPQEKATGYGGDRPYGAMVAPNSDENSLPLESAKRCKNCVGPEVNCACPCHKNSSLKTADLNSLKLNVGANFYSVTPLAKTDEKFGYEVTDSLGTKLFKIDTKQELNQEHLAAIIKTELNKKSPKMAKLVSNLAFLKKGTLVSIVSEDSNKKQIKFASLDNSLRGWAPTNKFAAFGDIEQKFMDHEGHKDEVFAESGNELLVSCPAGTTNISWRAVEAPPATPESLSTEPSFADEEIQKGYNNPDVLDSAEDFSQDIDASLHVNAHIRHENGKWVIYSHDFKKKLGTYDSKEAAEKRLRQIEYFKHQGSLMPLSKKEAKVAPGECPRCGTNLKPGKELCDTCKKNTKEANVMETKCEGCGKELGPEVFLSKHPVCGECTKKRHDKAVGRKADQDPQLSLEQQVQGFRDRMQAVSDRLANPPTKTADMETKEDLSKVDVKDLTEGILHMIDMLETKADGSEDVHPMLEELENKVWEVEQKLGIKPEIPEHEKAEPEHKEIVEEVEKSSSVEVKADDVNVPPTAVPPNGFRYGWDPKNSKWILVQDSSALGQSY